MKKIILLISFITMSFSIGFLLKSSIKPKNAVVLLDKSNILIDSIVEYSSFNMLTNDLKLNMECSMLLILTKLSDNQFVYILAAYPIDTSIHTALFSIDFETKKALKPNKEQAVFFNKQINRISPINLDIILGTNYGRIRSYDSKWEGVLNFNYSVIKDIKIGQKINGRFSLWLDNIETKDKIRIYECNFKNVSFLN